MRRTSSDPSQSHADVLEEELRDAGSPCTENAADPQDRLRAIHRHIHALDSKRSALCLSGGGIRSASFGLGVLQALARAGLLGKFDYLSTVSGGGYIGGWFTAWIQHHPKGQAGVIEELSAPPTAPTQPECAPIRHLRAFGNYLTPQLGVLSADAWTLAATVLRDILLNWIVLLSWLAALLLIPRFSVFAVLARPDPFTLHVLLACAFVSLAAATAYAGIDLPSLGNARWPQRRFLAGWLAPMTGAAAFFCAWWAGFRNTSDLAGPLMSSLCGLVLIQIFVGLASGAGCVASAVFLALRDRRGKSRAFAPDRIKRLVGMVLVTVLLTGALTGFFAWSIASLVFPDPARAARNFSCFAVPLLLALFFVANCVFNGVTSWWADDQDREWWGRATGWLCAGIAGWAILHGLVLWAPGIVAQIEIAEIWKWLLAAFGGVLGIVAAILGFSKGTVAQSPGSSPFSRSRLLAAAALGFFVLLSCVLSLFLDAPGGQLKDPAYLWDARVRVQFAGLLGLIGVLAAIGVAMGFFINVNKFSLHAVYRNRLIRAFLGASRAERKPHWFTGFDPEDNIKIHRLKPGRPFHVVNIALNLVKGGQLAWQERKAASFTVSRLHCGSWPLGYRPAAQYGNGISLGTALAVSGAAASPNQGYNSSPLVAFLMTLFNLRLGWWLGNPGRHGARTWRRHGPLHAALPLFNEALGNTTDTYPYVYLSDGGHFDNLGLYEMVLRRCRHIVAIDAGCDSAYVFEDLGNAIRKIRIDFGIPIDIRVVSPKKQGATAAYFAIGTIRYSAIDGPGTDGKLLYIKPVICGAEPADVAHYAAAHPDFPHESTSDQWFSESQMESYRALGFHAVSAICQDLKSPDIASLFAGLEARPASISSRAA
ncbi:MAG: hypothetical protein PHC88_06010 [Terrimicrobiaceae bacterium]|nr:hypothetical protein [Terrimicrobiaceae bacterium]